MVLNTLLLQALTPDRQVLIWLDDAPLGHSTPGLASVDYLLDGLVCGHLNSHSEEQLDKVVFSHPLYGRPFWVAYANVDRTAPEAFLKTLLAVVPGPARAKAVVQASLPLSSTWEKGLAQSFGELISLT